MPFWGGLSGRNLTLGTGTLFESPFDAPAAIPCPWHHPPLLKSPFGLAVVTTADQPCHLRPRVVRS
jgi:hypothetical protein